MKIKNDLLALIAIGAALSSCDPGATTIVYFENETEQEVEYQAFGTPREDQSASIIFEKLTIAPHSRVVVGTAFAIGKCCIEGDASHLLAWRSDSICITFVDHSLLFHRDSISIQQHSPYFYESFHLENQKSSWSSSTADAVYVITEEDYERAK